MIRDCTTARCPLRKISYKISQVATQTVGSLPGRTGELQRSGTQGNPSSSSIPQATRIWPKNFPTPPEEPCFCFRLLLFPSSSRVGTEKDRKRSKSVATAVAWRTPPEKHDLSDAGPASCAVPVPRSFFVISILCTRRQRQLHGQHRKQVHAARRLYLVSVETVFIGGRY